MMIRVVSMSYVALVAALVFGAYHVKLETQALERDKQLLNRDIAEAKADIDILQAEWATRTSPDYLKRLVADHLPQMRSTEPMQLSSLERVPLRSRPQDAKDQIERLLSMVELRTVGPQSTAHARPTL